MFWDTCPGHCQINLPFNLAYFHAMNCLALYRSVTSCHSDFRNLAGTATTEVSSSAGRESWLYSACLIGKWNSHNSKEDETEAFGCLGHSSWTICILLSHFCSGNFPTFSLSYWEANSYYPRGPIMGKGNSSNPKSG